MYTKLAPLMAREFNVRRVRLILSSGNHLQAMMGYRNEFMENIEDATEQGILSDDDETRIQVTDLIIRSLRKSDGTPLWFAVEASGVINDDDISRAKRSADIITKVYEQDATPLVYGYRIHNQQRKLAGELGVRVYLDPDSD